MQYENPENEKKLSSVINNKNNNNNNHNKLPDEILHDNSNNLRMTLKHIDLPK